LYHRVRLSWGAPESRRTLELPAFPFFLDGFLNPLNLTSL
jgi:hypothetical protein